LNQVATENSGEKSKGSHNACPDNQSRFESEVAITFHLQLCSAHYTALQMNNSVRNFSAMNPCHFRKSQWEAVSRYHKSMPCIVSEKNWNKGGQR